MDKFSVKLRLAAVSQSSLLLPSMLASASTTFLRHFNWPWLALNMGLGDFTQESEGVNKILVFC